MINNNAFSSQERLYVSPKAKVIFVKIQGILCGSEIKGAVNTTEMEEGDDNW